MVMPNIRPTGSDQANGSFMSRLAPGVVAAPLVRFYHRGRGRAITSSRDARAALFSVLMPVPVPYYLLPVPFFFSGWGSGKGQGRRKKSGTGRGTGEARATRRAFSSNFFP